MYQGSAAFGLFLCHFYNWHISVNEWHQFVHTGVNETQNSLHHLTSLICSVVVNEGTNQKLTHTNHNCSNGCYIVDQSVDEGPVECVGGFHNIREWEVCVENSSTTDQT